MEQCFYGDIAFYNADGTIALCANSSEWANFVELSEQQLYLIGRLPEYVVFVGFALGIVVLLLTALVVYTVLS
jgi:hypothetical protein